MNNKILVFIILCMMCFTSKAQTLAVQELSIATRDKATVEVSLTEASSYVATGFIITLPDGFKFTNNNDIASTNHEIQTAVLSDNIIKIIIFSTTNQPFIDGEAAILNLEIKAGLPKGTYHGTISKIEYATTDNQLVTKDDVTFNIEVVGSGSMLGDANGDGNLTIADYTAVAHYIQGNAPENFDEQAADVNGDGKINVADYTGIAHLILYGTIEKPSDK